VDLDEHHDATPDGYRHLDCVDWAQRPFPFGDEVVRLRALYTDHRSALNAIVRAGKFLRALQKTWPRGAAKAMAEWPSIRHTLESAIEAVKGKRGRATDYRR
jgi:hypothetical protein